MAVSDSTTDMCVRVECCPHALDAEGPVRLLLVDGSERLLARLAFTPAQARSSAYGMGRILCRFLPPESAHRVADGLRTAAIKVWAARN